MNTLQKTQRKTSKLASEVVFGRKWTSCHEQLKTCSQASPAFALRVIQDLDGRDKPQAEITKSTWVHESQRLSFRRLPTLQRVNRLEEGLYWLLSAIVLIYLVFAIIGR